MYAYIQYRCEYYIKLSECQSFQCQDQKESSPNIHVLVRVDTNSYCDLMLETKEEDNNNDLSNSSPMMLTNGEIVPFCGCTYSGLSTHIERKYYKELQSLLIEDSAVRLRSSGVLKAVLNESYPNDDVTLFNCFEFIRNDEYLEQIRKLVIDNIDVENSLVAEMHNFSSLIKNRIVEIISSKAEKNNHTAGNSLIKFLQALLSLRRSEITDDCLKNKDRTEDNILHESPCVYNNCLIILTNPFQSPRICLENLKKVMRIEEPVRVDTRIYCVNKHPSHIIFENAETSFSCIALKWLTGLTFTEKYDLKSDLLPRKLSEILSADRFKTGELSELGRYFPCHYKMFLLPLIQNHEVSLIGFSMTRQRDTSSYDYLHTVLSHFYLAEESVSLDCWGEKILRLIYENGPERFLFVQIFADCFHCYTEDDRLLKLYKAVDFVVNFDFQLFNPDPNSYTDSNTVTLQSSVREKVDPAGLENDLGKDYKHSPHTKNGIFSRESKTISENMVEVEDDLERTIRFKDPDLAIRCIADDTKNYVGVMTNAPATNTPIHFENSFQRSRNWKKDVGEVTCMPSRMSVDSDNGSCKQVTRRPHIVAHNLQRSLSNVTVLISIRESNTMGSGETVIHAKSANADSETKVKEKKNDEAKLEPAEKTNDLEENDINETKPYLEQKDFGEIEKEIGELKFCLEEIYSDERNFGIQEIDIDESNADLEEKDVGEAELDLEETEMDESQSDLEEKDIDETKSYLKKRDIGETRSDLKGKKNDKSEFSPEEKSIDEANSDQEENNNHKSNADLEEKDFDEAKLDLEETKMDESQCDLEEKYIDETISYMEQKDIVEKKSDLKEKEIDESKSSLEGKDNDKVKSDLVENNIDESNADVDETSFDRQNHDISQHHADLEEKVVDEEKLDPDQTKMDESECDLEEDIDETLSYLEQKDTVETKSYLKEKEIDRSKSSLEEKDIDEANTDQEENNNNKSMADLEEKNIDEANLDPEENQIDGSHSDLEERVIDETKSFLEQKDNGETKSDLKEKEIDESKYSLEKNYINASDSELEEKDVDEKKSDLEKEEMNETMSYLEQRGIDETKSALDRNKIDETDPDCYTVKLPCLLKGVPLRKEPFCSDSPKHPDCQTYVKKKEDTECKLRALDKQSHEKCIQLKTNHEEEMTSAPLIEQKPDAMTNKSGSYKGISDQKRIKYDKCCPDLTCSDSFLTPNDEQIIHAEVSYESSKDKPCFLKPPAARDECSISKLQAADSYCSLSKDVNFIPKEIKEDPLSKEYKNILNNEKRMNPVYQRKHRSQEEQCPCSLKEKITMEHWNRLDKVLQNLMCKITDFTSSLQAYIPNARSLKQPVMHSDEEYSTHLLKLGQLDFSSVFDQNLETECKGCDNEAEVRTNEPYTSGHTLHCFKQLPDEEIISGNWMDHSSSANKVSLSETEDFPSSYPESFSYFQGRSKTSLHSISSEFLSQKNNAEDIPYDNEMETDSNIEKQEKATLKGKNVLNSDKKTKADLCSFPKNHDVSKKLVLLNQHEDSIAVEGPLEQKRVKKTSKHLKEISRNSSVDAAETTSMMNELSPMSQNFCVVLDDCGYDINVKEPMDSGDVQIQFISESTTVIAYGGHNPGAMLTHSEHIEQAMKKIGVDFKKSQKADDLKSREDEIVVGQFPYQITIDSNSGESSEDLESLYPEEFADLRGFPFHEDLKQLITSQNNNIQKSKSKELGHFSKPIAGKIQRRRRKESNANGRRKERRKKDKNYFRGTRLTNHSCATLLLPLSNRNSRHPTLLEPVSNRKYRDRIKGKERNKFALRHPRACKIAELEDKFSNATVLECAVFEGMKESGMRASLNKSRRFRPKMKKLLSVSGLSSEHAHGELGHENIQCQVVSDIDSGVYSLLTIRSSILTSFNRFSKSPFSKTRGWKKTPKEFRELESFNSDLKALLRSLERAVFRNVANHNDNVTVFPGLQPYFDSLRNGERPSLQERMRYEWLRLMSFSSYTGAGSPVHLAQNGFYHLSGNETCCFCCNSSYSSWTYTDNVQEIHRRISPNCPFVNDGHESNGNISIEAGRLQNEPRNMDNCSTSVPSQRPTVIVNQGGFSFGTDVGFSVSGETTPTTTTVMAPGFSFGTASARPNPSGFGFSNASGATGSEQEGQSTGTAAVTGASAFHFGVASIFQGPSGSGFSQSASQQTGGADVSTQLTGLTGALTIQQSTGAQQPSDEPFSGNPVVAPTQSQKVLRQTDGDSQLTVSAQQQPGTHELQQSSTRSQRPSEAPGSGADAPQRENADLIQLGPLKHPRYDTMATRISSFQSWPNYLNQTPRQMAYAGFFHPGVADFARCFCCGGGLRNWEADDDPMVEHARWYPRCEYINKLKGTHFIQAVLRRHREHMAERQRQQETAQNQTSFLTPDPMSTSVAANLLEMGFPQDRAREAILTVRRLRGRSEVSVEEVMAWMLDEDTAPRDEPTRTGATAGGRDTVGNSPAEPPRSRSPAKSSSNGSESAAVGRQDSDSHTSVEEAQGTKTDTQGATGGAEVKGSLAESKSGGDDSSSEEKEKSSKENISSNKKPTKDKKAQSRKDKSKRDRESRARKEHSPGPSEGASLLSHGDVDTKSLKAENKVLKQMQVCKICMDKYVSVTFLPCGHLVCCGDCAKNMRKCPICRKRIKGQVRTFMS